MHRLDFHAPPKAGEALRAGSLCSLDANGQLIAGVPAGADANRPMPLFAIQDINDFDANSDVGNISGGVMSAIVATGGFEIETTEVDVAVTVVPNDLLTADTTTAGYVAKATTSPYAAEPIVGCVSKGVSVNADGKHVIRFWTVYLPAGA